MVQNSKFLRAVTLIFLYLSWIQIRQMFVSGRMCTENSLGACSGVVLLLSLNNLFVCFVALRPKSTAMVIAGRSVHLTTLFPGQA